MLLSDKNRIFFVREKDPVSSFCPVCLFLARDFEDLEIIQKEKACRECTGNFKYLDLESWEKGARPSVEEARAKMQIYIGEI